MEMPFELEVPGAEGGRFISIDTGSSVFFVGANGCGKSRLAVHFETAYYINIHRISAHRALILNNNAPKISEQDALGLLRSGVKPSQFQSQNVDQYAYRLNHRWQKAPATALLNDFDALIQFLFAQHANKAIEMRKSVVDGRGVDDYNEKTILEKLVEIWGILLPARELSYTGDKIFVMDPVAATKYDASEMSDGERAIFYLIGQSLTAKAESLLIIDEPELHVHRSIMCKLWDEIEAARPDCAFVFITHDLEFAASRVGQKFVIRSYNPRPFWEIEEVPEDTGFDEEITTLLMGSRP
jgi:energy-coupling factor transporter ATP-binding protein EcfA2